MKLLDLFCCAGGAAKGYQRAGFYVVGVDIKPQPNYCGDEFYQDDALEFLAQHGHEFDAVHASPPCQHYSAMQHIHHNPEKHPNLIPPTRELLKEIGKPYVIENVEGAPLRIDLMLCGTMFRLPLARHRIFELSFPFFTLVPPCQHEKLYDPFHGGEMARGEKEKFAQAMGVDWFMTRYEIRQAIPPAYTEYIGRKLIESCYNSSVRQDDPGAAFLKQARGDSQQNNACAPKGLIVFTPGVLADAVGARSGPSTFNNL